MKTVQVSLLLLGPGSDMFSLYDQKALTNYDRTYGGSYAVVQIICNASVFRHCLTVAKENVFVINAQLC